MKEFSKLTTSRSHALIGAVWNKVTAYPNGDVTPSLNTNQRPSQETGAAHLPTRIHWFWTDLTKGENLSLLYRSSKAAELPPPTPPRPPPSLSHLPTVLNKILVKKKIFYHKFLTNFSLVRQGKARQFNSPSPHLSVKVGIAIITDRLSKAQSFDSFLKKI